MFSTIVDLFNRTIKLKLRIIPSDSHSKQLSLYYIYFIVIEVISVIIALDNYLRFSFVTKFGLTTGDQMPNLKQNINYTTQTTVHKVFFFTYIKYKLYK